MDESNLRVSDSDRDDTIAVLREAFAEGRLTQEEFDDRLEATHSARTYGELATLTADIPTRTTEITHPVREKKKRRELKSAWASWLGVGVMVNIIWFATWMGSGPAPYYWPIWVIGPWGGAMVIWTLTSKAERASDG